MGYNGMPAGWNNNCEDVEWMTDTGSWGLSQEEIKTQWPFEGEMITYHSDETSNRRVGRYRLKTKPEVLHAESNAISKLAKSSESGNDATLFVTHSPCLDCAKLIYQSGISSVYYRNSYRDDSGIKFLEQSGIKVTKLENDA
jgi:deoxycytidylate deaminase